ncbi:MAG: hypothetical protein SFY80_13805 [Verrucomicrobiota bacterium]|nr:hypothetical protein [Verrucomicrobiota bacterium]
MDNYSVSWTRVTEKRGAAGAIVLKDHYTLPNYNNEVDAVKAIMAQHALSIGHLKTAYVLRDAKRSLLSDVMRRFNYLVMFDYEDLHLDRPLPSVPASNASQLTFLHTCEAYKELWELLAERAPEGLPTPLVLEGGYSLADFTTEVTALQEAYRTIIKLKQDCAFLRITRVSMLRKLKGRIYQYRARIMATLDKDDDLRKSLPRIAPDAGAKADKVDVTVRWDAVAQKAVLEWTPSVRPELIHYDIRGCNEGPYNGEREYLLARVSKDTTTWMSAEGLGSEGSQMLYKVYVVTSGHRERGSKSVKVVRPAALQQAA